MARTVKMFKMDAGEKLIPMSNPVVSQAYRDFKAREMIKLSYCLRGHIGQGTFGKVVKIFNVTADDVDLFPDKEFAMKIVFQDPHHCNRELEILEELRGHVNLLHLYYSYYARADSKIYLNLITELLHNTLYDKIYSRSTRTEASKFKHFKKIPLDTNIDLNSTKEKVPFHMDETTVKRYTSELFSGLAFMHSKNIAHRDLKPENISFTETDTLKVIDMGSAKKLVESITNSADICTMLYRAPELILGNSNYNCLIDVWAAACIMTEMITGRPMFCCANKQLQIVSIAEMLGRPHTSLMSNTSREMIQRLAMVELVYPQEQLRKKIPQLDVPGTMGHCTLEMLLLNMFRYESRFSAERVLQSRYLTPKTRKNAR